MDNPKYKSHPHICFYLYHLWNIEKLTGREMLDRLIQMQVWLDINCIENNKTTFKWCDIYSKYPADYNVEFNGVGIHGYKTHHIQFSNFLAFKRKEDLLAFMLRWGISQNSIYPEMYS